LTGIGKKCVWAIYFTLLACSQEKANTFFLLNEIESVRKNIAEQYYIPTYHEKDFPPPSIILKKTKHTTIAQTSPIRSGSRSSKKIALTFDACSTLLPSRFDSAVADILISTKTPATIFMGGKWALDRPLDAVFLSSVPFFEIGNHSYLHGHLTNVSDDRLYHEILWAQEIIYTVTGKMPVAFRAPYLESDARVIKAASELGLTTIDGDLPSGDPDDHATKQRLIDEINYRVKNGSIIIMHINKGGKHTAEALPEIIRMIRNAGYEFVTVSQLLDTK
jgi:peptidoglycan/xylan/chitin deacetylase (PgdA/CDA1 family)